MSRLFAQSAGTVSEQDEVLGKVLAFFSQRLLVQVKEKGYGHELAALAISVTGHRPLQVLRFLEVFSKIQGSTWFTNLVTAAVRVRNILARSGGESSVEVDPSLFSKDVEIDLCGDI